MSISLLQPLFLCILQIHLSSAILKDPSIIHLSDLSVLGLRHILISFLPYKPLQ
jgi:hypothetical protein